MTTRADLLDATGRRIVIEDRTAGVEILRPDRRRGAGRSEHGSASRARSAGRTTRHASRPSAINVLAVGARPLALDLQRAPTAAHEWRLVRVSGTVADVHKLGDAGGRSSPSAADTRRGQRPRRRRGSRPPTLVEGRTRDDRRDRPAAVPGRVGSPLVDRPAEPVRRRRSAAPRPVRAAATTATSPTRVSVRARRGLPPARHPPTPNVDLVDLAGHVGQVVRVGGLVAELAPDGFLLDDGTASGGSCSAGAAAEYLPLLEPGDALNATGGSSRTATSYRIVVDDPAGLVRVGDPDARRDRRRNRYGRSLERRQPRRCRGCNAR